MAFSTQASTVDDILRDVFDAIAVHGEASAATRGPFREIVGASFELTNVRARLSRSESRRRAFSGIAELCWYLSGSNRGEPVAFYMPRYVGEVEEDGTIRGAYGPRMFGEGHDAQVHNVIKLLSENPTSRRAVVQLFDRTDHGPPRYKDVPCTCAMQFILRAGRLHVVVSMRSNDAYIGLPHDVFAFTMLQEMVARSLEAEPGRYVHQVGSLHLYDENADSVLAYLDEGYQSTVDGMPPMPHGDPWPHAVELVSAERQIRAGVPYAQLRLPREPYWADLARVLSHGVARRSNDRELMSHIASEVHDGVVREFM